MRLGVTGSRNYDNWQFVTSWLDRLHARYGIDCLIHGAAKGWDWHSQAWAQRNRIPDDPYPADWDNITRPGAVVRRNRRGKLYDAAAGPYRNERMLREGRPEYAIAFPGGRGTRDMMIRCWEYGLEPFVCRRPIQGISG